MQTPKSIEWDIGQDIHGRRVTLRQQRDYANRVGYSIISEPSSQRDEGEKIMSLSRENLEAITGLLHGRGV